MHSLEYLRQKEIKDMQLIAQKVGKSEELGDVLCVMVEKRYNQLSSLFEENLRNVQNVLIQDMNTDEREKFEETLEEKREEFSRLIENDSKTMDEYIEDIISRNNIEQKDSSDENRPVIYNPKQNREKYEENQKKPENLSPSHKDYTLIQESTINLQSSDEEKQESLNLFINDIKISPSSSNSSKEMEQISILSPSPSQNSRKKMIKLESPPQELESTNYIKEKSLDPSSSLIAQENSLLDHLQQDSQGPSYTPDYIPERPSAPLQYFDYGNPNVSPGIASSTSENDIVAENNSDVEWAFDNNIDITPELVVNLAEQILIRLISEGNINEQRRDPPELPLLNILNIGPAPEGSFSTDPRIETDPNAVRKYVDEIFLHSDLQELQNSLKVPLRRKPLELLNCMQEVEIGSIIESEFLNFPEILSVNLYLSLENNRDNSTRPSISPRIHQIIIEAEHIHNKMIFDATNEVLQKYRPYGLKGAPMP